MNFKLAFLVLLPLAAFAAQSGTETAPVQDPNAIPAVLQERYAEAFQFYTQGDYAQAITKWNEILTIDPRQKSAQQMIEEARARIAESMKQRQERLLAFIRGGQYEAAYLELQQLIENDATHPLYKTLSDRLPAISKIVPKAPEGKAWGIAVKGLGGVLGEREDVRLAHNGLRYALDLDPAEPRFQELLEWLYALKPGLSFDDVVTPGMKFMEYKRFVALHHIYDGKGHSAVQTLSETLALEPDDLISLKRLGSAYYTLGKREQAREAWTRALRLAPDDAQLKKFLGKLGAQPAEE
jgi:tetratricopeptide (TPR) repeat protein